MSRCTLPSVGHDFWRVIAVEFFKCVLLVLSAPQAGRASPSIIFKVDISQGGRSLKPLQLTSCDHVCMCVGNIYSTELEQVIGWEMKCKSDFSVWFGSSGQPRAGVCSWQKFYLLVWYGSCFIGPLGSGEMVHHTLYCRLYVREALPALSCLAAFFRWTEAKIYDEIWISLHGCRDMSVRGPYWQHELKVSFESCVTDTSSISHRSFW